MRRVYTKPCLIVESFQLNAAVATSCSSNNLPLINKGLEECVAADGELFSAACNTDIVDNETDSYDTLCYHGPTGELQVTKYFMAS